MVAVAGCSAGDDGALPTTDPATESATATPQATETNTETGTATATPSEAVRAGNDAITEVEETLDAIVRQYAGAGSDDILDVDVTTEFNSALLDNSLREATEEVEVARERAVTEAQRQTVERLAGAVRFFVLATEVQTKLTGAFFDVQRARRALDQEDATDVKDALRGIRVELTIVRDPFESLQSETSRVDFTVVERLSPETYDAKVAQFEAELGGLTSFRNALDGVENDVNRLLQARTEQENGEDPTESAEAAVEEFSARADRLTRIVANLPAAADALEPVVRDFVAIVRAKADLARELLDGAT